ncbi:hypothetical protein [Halohasta salina]|uniref:hypothetical protein n=1 Tax=Halohasta salina TaxID=2961621 RepID=UPI0020A38722|nr:hypothetical protein [Halohasta salina]
MVLTELVEMAIEAVGGLIGAHGFKAGLVATSLVVLYHGHSILSFIQTAIQTARIAFFGAAAVALLLIVGVSMGWLSVGSLPTLPLPLVGIWA